MTTPPADTPQPAPQQPQLGQLPPTISINAMLIPADDGEPLVCLITQYGTTSTTMAVNEQTAQALAGIYPQVLTAALAELRRAKSGLVVASPDQLRGLVLPPNGKAR